MARTIQTFCRPTDWQTLEKLLSDPEKKAAPIILSTRPKEVFRRDTETAIDLTEMDLSYIRKNGQTIEIGSMTNLQMLVESQELSSMLSKGLCVAARRMARINMRNQASVSGVLMDFEGPGDLPAVLMAIGSNVIIRKGDQTRKESLNDFCQAGCKLNSGELMAAIEFPAELPGALSFDHVARTPQDQATVFAAAYLENKAGQITKAGVAVAGTTPYWRELSKAEEALTGKAYTAELAQTAAAFAAEGADPVSDFRGSKEYRTAVSVVLVRRSIENAWKQLH